MKYRIVETGNPDYWMIEKRHNWWPFWQKMWSNETRERAQRSIDRWVAEDIEEAKKKKRVMVYEYPGEKK